MEEAETMMLLPESLANPEPPQTPLISFPPTQETAAPQGDVKTDYRELVCAAIRDPGRAQHGGKRWNIRCWFGFHDWRYTSNQCNADRYCRRCGRHELAGYDAVTGEMVYME